jgi:hypothetical protein
LKDCVEIVGLPRTGEEPALFQRDAVLATLQNAYDARNINLIDGILDDEFVFFFSERDYMQGRVPFPQWGREDEFAATANMFSSQPPAGALTSVSLNDRLRHVGASEEITWGIIKNLFFSGAAGGDTDVFLLLVYNKGEDNWVSMLPPDPVRYPDEVWYQKTANYFLMVTTGGYTYQAILVQAEFTVRYSEPKGGWQLVQWRDDI